MRSFIATTAFFLGLSTAAFAGGNPDEEQDGAMTRDAIERAEEAGEAKVLRAAPSPIQQQLKEQQYMRAEPTEEPAPQIARALLVDPRVLVMDEATSSVDTVTEALIQEALERLLAGRSAIVIAHRLSTVRNADQILVLNEGRLVERGGHEKLLERGGYYADLVHNQTETENHHNFAAGSSMS